MTSLVCIACHIQISSIGEKEIAMAENHEIMEASSYGEEATVSSAIGTSLETRRSRVSQTGQAENSVLIFDRLCIKRWQDALLVTVVGFILYIVYAWWQWQIKGNVVVMQLLRRKDNETAHDVLAANDLIFQGERTFYIVSIIILVICVVVWLGWTKTFQGSKAEAAERVENEKAETQAAREELQAEKADKERLEEEVRHLEQELTRERRAKEREISDKQRLESILAETQEQKDDCQQRIAELELSKEQMKADLDEEKSLRQQAEEALEAEKHKHQLEIKELKANWWWRR